MILLDEHAVWNVIWSSFLSFSMSEAFVLPYRPSYGIEWLLRFFFFARIHRNRLTFDFAVRVT